MNQADGDVVGQLGHPPLDFIKQKTFKKSYVKKSARRAKFDYYILKKKERVQAALRKSEWMPLLREYCWFTRFERELWLESGFVVSKEFNDFDGEGKIFRANFLGLVVEGDRDIRNQQPMYHVS